MSNNHTPSASRDASPSDPLYYEPHPPGRPLTVVQDANGDRWLCDKDVDLSKDLREQGCWRCDEMAFPDGGR